MYAFPAHSYVGPKTEISILYKTLGFSPKASSTDMIQLLSNAYKPIDHYPEYTKRVSQVPFKLVTDESTNNDIKTLTSGNFFGEPDSALEKYLQENPDKLEVDFGDENIALGTQSNQSHSSLYYSLGALVLMLGAARILKSRDANRHATQEDFGTIEVIE